MGDGWGLGPGAVQPEHGADGGRADLDREGRVWVMRGYGADWQGYHLYVAITSAVRWRGMKGATQAVQREAARPVEGDGQPKGCGRCR